MNEHTTTGEDTPSTGLRHAGAVLLDRPDNNEPRCFGQISVAGHVVRCGETPHVGTPHSGNLDVPGQPGQASLAAAVIWAYKK